MRAGDTIAGAYRIQRMVRSGGISVVYRAEEIRSRRAVAVKVINISQADVAFKRRIEREISVLRKLAHPHIVRCLGSGRLESNRMYLVLEWLEGCDLADAMTERPLTLRAVLELVVQISDALTVAHREGVIHRDIKPANIFLMQTTRDGGLDARLIDFGVAKVPESAQAITKAGAVLGTPSYMAPEQANYAMDVDGRADVYSLGVVIFELLTGRLPWVSTTDLARLARILIEEALPLETVSPDIPSPVASLVNDMLASQVEARIGSAEAVRELAQSHLEVLAGRELDRVYAEDEVGRIIRSDTLDIAPQVIRRHSTPTRALSIEPGGLLVAPPVIRKRSSAKPAPPSRSASPIMPQGLDDEEDAAETLMYSPEAAMPSPSVERTAIAAPSPKLMVEEPASRPYRARFPSAEDLVQPRSLSEADLMSATEALSGIDSEALEDFGFDTIEAPPDSREFLDLERIAEGTMYGRIASIDRIQGRVERSMRNEQPSLTIVIGPAGIGKTRLRKELSIITRANTSARILVASAEELQRSTPYSTLRRMIFAELGIVSDDDPSAMRVKLLRMIPPAEDLRKVLSELDAVDARQPDAVIGPQGPGRTHLVHASALEGDADEFLDDPDEERALLAAFVCEALGISYPNIPALQAARQEPRLLGQQTERALEVMLRCLAARTGLVLLVDDAHFMDRASGMVLRRLLDRRKPIALAVEAFALPTFLDPQARERSPLTHGVGADLETIELGPLEARPSREMVRNLVPNEIASDDLETLVQRAHGNPLFLEQLVRTVLATGALRSEDGGELSLKEPEAGRERIPPTVAAAVSARMSSLRPPSQRILAAAAVFGEVFWAEGVAHLLGQSVHEVTPLLDELVNEAFVRSRPIGRYRAQSEMEFHHAVIRSVALARLKRKRRLDFERRAADYLESVCEQDLGVLASHISASADLTRGARMYLAAGAKSLALGASMATGTLLEEGLRLAEAAHDDTLRLEAYDLIEQVAMLNRDWESGRDVLDARTDLVTSATGRTEILERRSRLAYVSKRFEESRIEAQEARNAWESLKDTAGVARADLLFAEASEALADGRSAVRSYLSALKVFESAQIGLGVIRSTYGLARVAMSSGDYRSAEDRFRNALVQARARHDYDNIYAAQMGLAEMSRLTGDLARTRQFLEEAAASALDRERRLLVRVEQAVLSGEGRRFRDAMARLDRIWHIATIAPELGLVRRRTALRMGQMLRRPIGQEEEPRAEAGRLDEVHEQLLVTVEEAVTEEPSLLLALRLSRAWTLALQGRTEEAAGLARDVEEQFARTGMVAWDEPPAVLYTLARIHRRVDPSSTEVRRLVRTATAQLDSTCSRLARPVRRRYLERWLARTILEDATQIGIELVRDPESHRLAVGD